MRTGRSWWSLWLPQNNNSQTSYLFTFTWHQSYHKLIIIYQTVSTHSVASYRIAYGCYRSVARRFVYIFRSGDELLSNAAF